MNTIETIINTRSIRKYTDQQVPREILDQILEAGTHAANAGGGMNARFLHEGFVAAQVCGHGRAAHGAAGHEGGGDGEVKLVLRDASLELFGNMSVERGAHLPHLRLIIIRLLVAGP